MLPNHVGCMPVPARAALGTARVEATHALSFVSCACFILQFHGHVLFFQDTRPTPHSPSPEKRSGLREGRITASCNACLAPSSPVSRGAPAAVKLVNVGSAAMRPTHIWIRIKASTAYPHCTAGTGGLPIIITPPPLIPTCDVWPSHSR